MNYYLAPLEGITTHIYRRTVAEYFGEAISKYFTPFFASGKRRKKDSSEIKEILPENNEGCLPIPQILTTDAADFLAFERDMLVYGYRELNLNFGCPSGTVASKGRGSGFLCRKEEMKEFLDEVFLHTQAKVSIKTRIGTENKEEFPEILEIYNRYPIHELIIHPRVRRQMYKGSVDTDTYRYAEKHTKIPLCYNGDIRTANDVPPALDQEQTKALMCGRGMVKDPSLIRQLSGGKAAKNSEILAFLNTLMDRYCEEYKAEDPAIWRLKEIMEYMRADHPDKHKEIKILLKSKSLGQCRELLRMILSE